MPANRNSTAPAGPGAIDQGGIAPDPLLMGATELEAVTILNPLTVDFIGLVGQSKPIDRPFELRAGTGVTRDDRDLRMNYGLNLKNPDHTARMAITNKVTIRAGQTLTMLGNEAQVIVHQLVNEIMQREGRSLMLADPFQRRQVEETIVRARRSVEEVISRPLQSVQSQIQDGMSKINEGLSVDEPAFPDLKADATVSAGSTAGAGDTKSGISRPGAKKA